MNLFEYQVNLFEYQVNLFQKLFYLPKLPPWSFSKTKKASFNNAFEAASPDKKKDVFFSFQSAKRANDKKISW